MSGWELFTWINVAILGVGAGLVFLAFLRDLPGLLRLHDQRETAADEREPPG